MSSSQRQPLSSRPLDLIYLIFFVIHIPATLLLDVQALYPISHIPPQIAEIPKFYLQFSADPIIAGAFGLNGPPAYWVWLKCFLVLEAVFQLPVFFVGIRGLWKGSRSIYPLLLIYSASSATTTIACLSTLLRTKLSATPMPASLLDPTIVPFNTNLNLDVPPFWITQDQRNFLLLSYVPFLLIPLLMCFDMAIRVAGLIARGIRAENEQGRAGKKSKPKVN